MCHISLDAYLILYSILSELERRRGRASISICFFYSRFHFPPTFFVYFLTHPFHGEKFCYMKFKVDLFIVKSKYADDI